MITMTEIARLTHVSQPTVSRVLNGNKAVDPEIRERVLACAREHNYQSNALAKGLQGSQTHLLGVFLHNISNSFFADLAQEIEARAREHGYSIILFNSGHDPQKQLECMDVVRRYRVDGVLMVPVLRESEMWQECVDRLDVPMVVVTRQVTGFDSVYVDHEAAGQQVARHLAAQNYERFLFIGRPTDTKFKGFSQELETMGKVSGNEIGCFEYEDDEKFLQALKEWIGDSKQRVGIFANNDLWAMRTLKALQKLNISIPEEVGVIGFDNIYMDRYLQPSLSSVSQPIAQMAEESVNRLLHRINHPDETKALDVPLQATLIPREST